jgi:hypothetical protein
MLSDTCNILEFLDKAKKSNYQRIMALADREATDVERFLYRNQGSSTADTTRREYATTLKDFISFMRYGIKTRKMRLLDLEYFNDLRQTR